LHRSRTMTTVFNQTVSTSGNRQENSHDSAETTTTTTTTRGVGVVNCHLQGHPSLTTTRVKQLQNSLKELKSRFSHHAAMVVGDFNCCLQDSACSGYLAFGSVPQVNSQRERERNSDKKTKQKSISPHLLIVFIDCIICASVTKCYTSSQICWIT
jgi:endonuclease/exonuclease/phosphatase family metal-dependent hydrolase